MIYVCMAAAIVAMMTLFVEHLAIPSSLLFGLLGMAPAGVIMALTAQAMRPENRAIGMGLFFSVYFFIQFLAPAISGYFYDMTADTLWPMILGATLFLMAGVSNFAFRRAEKHVAIQ